MKNITVNSIFSVIDFTSHSNNNAFNTDLQYSELIYNINTKSVVTIDGKVFKQDDNSVRFLPKGKHTEYFVKGSFQSRCIDIFFDSDILLDDEPFYLELNQNKKIGVLFQKIYYAWSKKGDGYYLKCMKYLYEILYEILSIKYQPSFTLMKIQPAINYIAQNYLLENISTATLCEVCDISETYLKKLFHQRFGLSPKQYIIDLKMKYACELLTSNLFSVGQIAQTLGYENIYYFSKAFKQYYSLSPTEYAKKFRYSI